MNHDTMLRNPERIDSVIDLLRETWKKLPHWRLNQLIINAAAADLTEPSLDEVYRMEDDAMAARLSAIYNASHSPPA